MSADRNGANVIEVAATFDDSVVAVRHLAPARDRRPTRALLAAGAACLLACAIAFAHAVSVSAADQRAKAAWLAKGESLIDYPAPRLSAAWDVSALFGLMSGIGLLGWGLARLVDERRPSRFRVGKARGVDFATPLADDHELIAPAPTGGFVLNRFPGLSVEVDGLPTGGDVIPIAAGARLRAKSGLATFTVASVPSAKATGGALRLDRRALTFAGASAAGHLALIVLLFLVAPAANGYMSDEEPQRRLISNGQLDPKEEAIQKPEHEDVGGGSDMKGGSTTPEGAMGTKKPTTDHGSAEIQKVENLPPKIALTTEQKNQVARTAGVIGFIKNNNAFQAIANDGDFSVGLDDKDIEGGWYGNPGENPGGFGGGVAGMGPGGIPCDGVACSSLGTIAVGKYHVPGKGPGPIPGFVDPNHQHVPQAPVYIGAAETKDVDPQLLRRYVHEHVDEITYCYTHELQAKPTIEGTVTSHFTIDGNGRVITVGATGVDDLVSSCVAGVIKSIEFPKFDTVVNVTSYPFRFHSTN
jgi:hypothetical protein